MQANKIPGELVSLLRYEPETGKLFWRKAPRRGIAANTEAGKLSKGHLRITYKGVSYAAHRVAWVCVYGNLSEDVEVDHKNLVRSDNRMDNLRLANRTGNNANQAKRDGFTSKYKGVSWNKNAKKWCAQISIGNITRPLGRYGNELDAHRAYVMAATAAYGEFARAA